MPDSARIIFAGSPEFAVPTLNALCASRHPVVAVLTQPDRPVGRGRKLQPGPVKLAAIAAGIQVLQPASLRSTEVQQTLRELRPDLLIVVAYGQLLPPEVLQIPRVACVNVHASLLPRWRGASPVQSALLAGDAETGISIMQMDAGLDTGPVYCEARVTIAADATAGMLHDQLAELGGRVLADNLDAILAGSLLPSAQPTDGISYAGRISKSDALIDWRESAAAIERRVRAYNPWPVAETRLAGQQLRCWLASAVAGPADSAAAPGTVIGISSQGVLVQTGSGVLNLIEVQAAGRKRMAALEFVRAQPLENVVLG